MGAGRFTFGFVFNALSAFVFVSLNCLITAFISLAPLKKSRRRAGLIRAPFRSSGFWSMSSLNRSKAVASGCHRPPPGDSQLDVRRQGSRTGICRGKGKYQ